MTLARLAALKEEVNHIKCAGSDPANAARKRLLEIVDELLLECGHSLDSSYDRLRVDDGGWNHSSAFYETQI